MSDNCLKHALGDALSAEVRDQLAKLKARLGASSEAAASSYNGAAIRCRSSSNRGLRDSEHLRNHPATLG